MSTTFPSSRTISPSVRIIERDYSEYYAGDESNTTALVGFCGKGPLNVPTHVLNTEELFRLFGYPDPNVPSHLLYAAMDYLREGNDLWIVRVGQDDEADPEFARTAYVDVPTGGIHARVISEVTEGTVDGSPEWTFKGLSVDGDRFLRIRANTQAYVRELRIPSGTTFDWLTAHGTGVSLEELLQAQVTDDDGFEITHCGSGDNARLVIRSLINGPQSQIELVSSRMNIWSGATGLGLEQSNNTDADTTAGQYLPLDIGRSMTKPVLAGTAEAFNSSTAGIWRFGGYRMLKLEVVMYGTGDPEVDGAIQPMYLPKDELGDNLDVWPDLSPITTATLVDYLNGVHLLSPASNQPRGFFFVANGNAIDIVAGYPEGTIPTGGPAIGDVKAWYLTGHDAKIVVRPQSTADDKLGLEGSAIGTTPSPVLAHVSACAHGDYTGDPIGWEERANAGILRGDNSTTGLYCLRVFANTPGTEGNLTQVTVQVDPETSKISLLVDNRGQRVESWTNLHLNPNDPYDAVHYIENYINGYSDYIAVEHDTGMQDQPRTGTYVLGSTNLSDPQAGTNGIPVDPTEQADLIIGSPVRSSGINSLSEPERIEIDLVAVPGRSDTRVIEALKYLCEEQRRDCMFLVDPPFGMTPTEVRKWHNGQHPLNQVKFNSNYGALYWPWVLEWDPINSIDIWAPPSGAVLAIYARTDKMGGPWIAPAGQRRGVMEWVKQAEYVPYLHERDSLYAFDNAVNTLSTRPQLGVTVWGQKTLQRRPTALDRVNVRRMLLYAEKQIKMDSHWLIFEPHDDVLRSEFRTIVDKTMQRIVTGRGAYRYAFECDDILNPPEVVERNEMRARVRIEPAKAAEFIFIEFALYRHDNFDSVISDNYPVRYR